MGDFTVFSKSFLVASIMLLSALLHGKSDFSSHAKWPMFKIETTMERTPVFDDISIYGKVITAKVSVNFPNNELFQVNDKIIVRMCDTAPDNNPIINDKNGYTSYQVENNEPRVGFSVNLYPKLGEKMRNPILNVTVIRDGKIFAQSSPQVLFNAKQKQYNIIVKRVK